MGAAKMPRPALIGNIYTDKVSIYQLYPFTAKKTRSSAVAVIADRTAYTTQGMLTNYQIGFGYKFRNGCDSTVSGYEATQTIYSSVAIERVRAKFSSSRVYSREKWPLACFRRCLVTLPNCVLGCNSSSVLGPTIKTF